MAQFFNFRLEDKTIAIWGLAFKPGTDDIRNASSQIVIDALLNANATIRAFDPMAMQPMAQKYKEYSHRLFFADSALDALHQADALVLITEWPEFQKIPLHQMHQRLKQPVLFDGRNCFDPIEVVTAGFYYSSIGREASEPHKRMLGTREC